MLTQEEQDKAKLEWLADIVGKYLVKVGQEREARLAGRIAAADYYVRQLTWLEVVLDLGSGDGFRFLCDFRAEGRHLIDIVETPMSKLLGEARRAKWAELGDPPRPDHPPQGCLIDRGRFSIDQGEYTRGGLEKSHEEQRREFEERHRQAAVDQLAWEEAARRDYEERRDSDAES